MLSFSRGTLLSGHCHGLDQLLRDHAAQLLPRAGPDVLHPVRQRACADVGGDAVAAQAHGQPHHEADRNYSFEAVLATLSYSATNFDFD